MSHDERSHPDRAARDDATLTGLLRSAVPERPAPADHPDPEELLDYHLRALPDDAAEQVRDHLVACRECADTVLDFEAFPEVPESSRGGGDPGSAITGGVEHLARLGSPAGGAAPPGRAMRARPARLAARRGMAALAAGLLATTIGLAAWVAVLHLQARAPRTDVALHTLSPTGNEGTARGEPQEIVVADWAGRVLLLLSYGGLEAYERYRLALVDEGGRTIWEQSHVPRREDGSFAVEVDRRELPAGRAMLRLEGFEDGSAEVLAEYRLAVKQR